MWLYPWLTLLAIAAMLVILGSMAFIPDQRAPLETGLASLAIAAAVFWLGRLRLARRAAPAPESSPLN
jgi:GABA permease